MTDRGKIPLYNRFALGVQTLHNFPLGTDFVVERLGFPSTLDLLVLVLLTWNKLRKYPEKGAFCVIQQWPISSSSPCYFPHLHDSWADRGR